MYFEKLHATTEFLFERAAKMKLKMPLCETWQRDIAIYQEGIQVRRRTVSYHSTTNHYGP